MSKTIVGNDEAVQAGLDAQHESVVVLKNQDSTITCESPKDDYKSMKVYIPRAFDTGHDGAFGEGQYTEGPTVDVEVAKQYFGEVVTDEAVTDADDKVTSYTAPIPPMWIWSSWAWTIRITVACSPARV